MKTVNEAFNRIFFEADVLYEQAGRLAFPTVDAVRKAARVNMNDASSAMREWRRLQMVRAMPQPVPVPDSLRQSHDVALVALWGEAREVADQLLTAERQAWVAERAEVETLNKQLADAFEAQGMELDSARSEGKCALEQVERLTNEKSAMLREFDKLRGAVDAANAAAARADVRAEENMRRAEKLRVELDHVHRSAADMQAGLQRTSEAHALALMELKDELMSEHARLQRGWDEEKQHGVLAREAAAELRGQVDLLRTQCADLMRAAADRRTR